MKQSLIIIIFASMLAACGSMPKHEEIRADQLTSIVLTNLPAGATVSVDGRAFLGVNGEILSVPVEPGMHLVEVRLGSAVIYQREIFIDDGTTREIIVSN